MLTLYLWQKNFNISLAGQIPLVILFNRMIGPLKLLK